MKICFKPDLLDQIHRRQGIGHDDFELAQMGLQEPISNLELLCELMVKYSHLL
jgi:hypothetical protein